MSSDPEADQEFYLQMDAVQSPDELERDKQCELPVQVLSLSATDQRRASHGSNSAA